MFRIVGMAASSQGRRGRLVSQIKRAPPLPALTACLTRSPGQSGSTGAPNQRGDRRVRSPRADHIKPEVEREEAPEGGPPGLQRSLGSYFRGPLAGGEPLGRASPKGGENAVQNEFIQRRLHRRLERPPTANADFAIASSTASRQERSPSPSQKKRRPSRSERRTG